MQSPWGEAMGGPGKLVLVGSGHLGRSGQAVWSASPGSGPAQCTTQADPCPWHQSPICTVRGLDRVISQALPVLYPLLIAVTP